MGCVYFKTVRKGTALLFFVILQGMNAQSSSTKPDVIRNLTVSDFTTSSVFLKWDEPIGNRSSFKLQWTGDITNEAVTNHTSYNITGLTAGVNYTLNIRAVAADNVTEGQPIRISVYTKPDVILNLSVDNITTSSVTLNWTKPNGQSSHYRVEYENNNVTINETTEKTFITINNLIPGSQYTFKVFTVTADNVTEGTSDQISLYTRPDVIRNLNVSDITTSSVFLKWDEPIGNRSSFKLQWTGDKTDETVTNHTSYNITGLTAGVSYTLNIRAVAADNVTEGQPIRISVYTRPDMIRNLNISDITTSSVFLKWDEPIGNRSSFKLQWTGDKTDETVTNHTSYNITGLTAGVSYTLNITAVAADNVTEGQPIRISVYTRPDVIRNLNVSDITTSSVFLKWDEPIGNRSSFKLQWTGDKTDETVTNHTSYNITGLTAGVSYTFNIRAVAADNVTEGQPIRISVYTRPDVIRNLNVSDFTTSSVFLKWDEPIGNRSSFKLQWTGDKTDETVTNHTSYIITGLTAGVNYTLNITAVAADNVTEGQPIRISIYTRPDVIRNLTVSEITTSSVFLKWDEPIGNRSSFKLQWTGDKTDETVTNRTSYNITGLTAGVSYTLNIRAVAADNVTEGQPIRISVYTRPDVIRNLNVSDITTSSVFLKWDEPIGNRFSFKLQWTGDKIDETVTNHTSYIITGLTAGVNYTLNIKAVAADNVTEGQPIRISFYIRPDVIRNLTVSEITTSSVFLKWDEPIGNRSSFKLQWTGDKTDETVTNHTSYNITGLTAGVSYTLNIRAVAADNVTEGQPIRISVYTRPDMIRNLNVSDITSSSVFLKWDEPIGNRSSFKLQWAGDKTDETVTNHTSYNITGLTAGVSYTFNIRAVAADNVTEGQPIRISVYTRPDVIRNLNISDITTSSVFLKWDEPIGNRSSFKLQWAGDITNEAVTNHTSYNITGLTAGVSYTFNIGAVAADNVTEGQPIRISIYTRPDMIRNLNVSDITSSSVFLKWDEPVGNRSSFKLQWTGDKTDETVTNHTSHNITGLTAGVSYTFNIRAVAADNVTEGQPIRISVYTRPDVIRNLNVTDITTSSVFLKWDEPVGNRCSFKLQWTGDKTDETVTNHTSYNITGLTAGVSYTFNIRAVAADNVTEGQPIRISVYTRPDVIRNLNISDITTSSVFLKWDEPIGNRSSFKLQWAGDITNEAVTNHTSYNITGLTAGVSYTFNIGAVAADNVTEGQPIRISIYTRPDMIRNLNVSDITSSSVFLKWDEPVGNRSSFKLQWTGDKTDETVTNHTSHNITGLTAGVSYTFNIRAVAADNVTEGQPIRISVYTRPDVIRNLNVTDITTSSVFLKWDEPVGNRCSFKLQWTGDKTDETVTNHTSYNITGLTAGVSYTFNIRAVAADNVTEGQPIRISVYTRPDVIRNLNISDITTSSVFLKWDEPIGNRSSFKLQWAGDITNEAVTNHTSYNITGLTAGVSYTFNIGAVAADNVTEGQPIRISIYTRPDVIRNLNVSDITTSSVFLNWDEPIGNRSSFKLQWTGDKTDKTVTNHTTYNITGLTAGVNYTLNIRAVAADNVTEGQPIRISVFTRPDVIRNLNVSDITTSSVFLKWDEPIGNRSSFKLQWIGDQIDETVTNHTSYNITGLTAGVNYTLNIRAVAADNVTEGQPIRISVYTRPDVIRNLNVSDIKTSSVFLKWDEPIGNRSSFKLQWTGDITNKAVTNHTSYNITGLTAGVNYTFNITAVAADNVTEGQPIRISVYTRPDAIGNLNVSDITTSSVFLKWDEPIGNRFSFKLQWTGDKIDETVTNHTSYNITGLTAGVNYTLNIRAVAADNVTEGQPIRISVYTRPDVIRNFNVSDITTSSVFLKWDEPIGNRSSFKLQWTGDITKETVTNLTSYNITGLTAGVSYTFNITAVAADNVTEGQPIRISVYTRPDVIRNLNVSDISISSVFLKWDEPIGNRSSFKLQWTGDITNKAVTNHTSYNITGLTAGVNYTFNITAVAADNVTEGQPIRISVYTRPDVIRNLNVSDITTSSVFLKWNEPIGNRSSFKLQWTGDKIDETVTNHTSYNITGLTAGVNYTFNITAVAADNKTEGQPIRISVYTKPDVILNLRVDNTTTSSVSLNWTKPNGQSSHYRVEYENNNVNISETTEKTFITINNLIAGSQYTFKVFTVAADNVTEGRSDQISLYTRKLDKTGMIVGIALGVFCILITVTLILFFYSRRKTKEKCSEIPFHTISLLLFSMFSFFMASSSIALRIEDYEEYFKRKHADSNCGFAEEYEDLKPVGTAQPKNAALAIENKAKNRYSNVLPYDASRVKLSICGSPFDDYINANYIPGYNSRKEFIAAQGPLPITVNEFWRMIWEKNVYTIVMLTRCNEQGRVKCEKYWPSRTSLHHNISVTTTSEIPMESWTIRDFTIKNVKTAETRAVRHFHFTAWPDHGVPQTTEILIDFRHLVREHMDQYSSHSPSVVHCSAGVGRTGTFIAIDRLIFQIERESMVDVYGIVNDMRMHRPLMVQTEEQYVYLHQCAYDIIRSRTGTNVDLIYQNTGALDIYENLKFYKS
ncbi:receptor-type tyrosine-protein phosphatase eta-like [Myxocyprinus asiaticus]|uniref:receptor-type tyrosine-protein phosphatase eta-like n=1 Tax=Myxocyprinus asiaticus TaxID=70543 RepID=UPI002221ED5C|nr:receptor-type tyrosine-protein phosphatase eta-like [Myxocyprinus asiaticus]